MFPLPLNLATSDNRRTTTLSTHQPFESSPSYREATAQYGPQFPALFLDHHHRPSTHPGTAFGPAITGPRSPPRATAHPPTDRPRQRPLGTGATLLRLDSTIRHRQPTQQAVNTSGQTSNCFVTVCVSTTRPPQSTDFAVHALIMMPQLTQR